MKKSFTQLELFPLIDGRTTTNGIDIIYETLNHIFDSSFMTHHLPIAYQYLKEKNPNWMKQSKNFLISKGIELKVTPIEVCIEILKKDNKVIKVPQLKDEFNISDFEQYMIDNSLLLR